MLTFFLGDEASFDVQNLLSPHPDLVAVRVPGTASWKQPEDWSLLSSPPTLDPRRPDDSFPRQPSFDSVSEDNEEMATRSLLSVSSTGPAIYKQRAIREAEQQQKVINEKLRKLGLGPTGYQFRELIGKGSYGRVYKRYLFTILLTHHSFTCYLDC